MELVEICNCYSFYFHYVSDYTMAGHMFLLALDFLRG
jgi:hypothetical protein